MPAHQPDHGFAPDRQALAERRALAARMVGQHIVRVDYVTLDYLGWDLGYQDPAVRREVTDPTEWSEPTWHAGTFHHADWGVELTTTHGDTWGITWDTPGAGESLRLQPGLVADSGAVWNVTSHEPWQSCIQSAISDVLLRYHPWATDSDAFWCTRVTIFFGERRVEVLMGDREPSGTKLVPSADNIAVLLEPESLPRWERPDDLA